MSKRARKSGNPAVALRKAIKAGPRDVIDHLLVDAPPCDPDEERAVETEPMGSAAMALKKALEQLDGSLALDFTDKNVAAILELGGKVEIEMHQPAVGILAATLRPEGAYFDRVYAYCWNVYYVESREAAEALAIRYPETYLGWNEPPPPEKSLEQLEAEAQQARFEAAEAAMVAAAEKELAAERALLLGKGAA